MIPRLRLSRAMKKHIGRLMYVGDKTTPCYRFSMVFTMAATYWNPYLLKLMFNPLICLDGIVCLRSVKK